MIPMGRPCSNVKMRSPLNVRLKHSQPMAFCGSPSGPPTRISLFTPWAMTMCIASQALCSEVLSFRFE